MKHTDVARQAARASLSALMALVALLAGCADAADETRSSDHVRQTVAASPTGRTPGAVIDSTRPIAEHLARFRAGEVEPSTLDGASSRERLVRSAVLALARRDTAALRALMIGRAEFAYFFYPSSRLSRPPYEMPPDLLWMQLTMGSEKGLEKAIRSLPPRTLRYAGHECGRVEHEGVNVVHQVCTVRLANGETVRLFGSILERGGRFKLVSWANSL